MAPTKKPAVQTNPFTLPSSQVTVTLRDPKKVTEGARRPVVDALIAMSSAESDAQRVALSHEWDDLLVVTMVESWSRPEPITAADLMNLVGEDYDAIRVAARSTMPVLMPNYEITPDPDSPTPPLDA